MQGAWLWCSAARKLLGTGSVAGDGIKFAAVTQIWMRVTLRRVTTM